MELINFRDFGGHGTSSGGTVRTGRLFRCGHLAELSDELIRKVTDLDFTVIADLRYAKERFHEPSPWPLDYAARILSHEGERTSEAPHITMLKQGKLNVPRVHEFYKELYSDLPFNYLYRPLFASVVRQIAETGGPALIHCTAGKDRTGMLSAIILHCLGVPQETIVADYLRSSGAPGLMAMKPRMIERSKRRYNLDIPVEAVDALLDARAEYLQTALNTINARCGSIENYLAESDVGPDVIQRLREQLVVQ